MSLDVQHTSHFYVFSDFMSPQKKNKKKNYQLDDTSRLTDYSVGEWL